MRSQKRIDLVSFCPTSSFRAPAKLAPLRCPNTSAPLEFTGLPPFTRGAIDASQPGLWRYASMLPVVADDQPRLTLGEGWTPLIADEWAGVPLYWKMESHMPTGSFKDRGISVMMNWLLGLNTQRVVEDSSGNAGASVACYGARADLDVCIYVPESAPETKKAQIAFYGAELVEVPGPRDAASDAAVAATLMDKNTRYASHVLQPAFVLGTMTCAWEIWEQLDFEVPDWFVLPVGQGGLLLGVWRGFQHLKQSGLISRLPKLVAVQAEPYTPLYHAFNAGLDKVTVRRQFERISADGIAISNPLRHETLLKAIRRSGGTVIAVTDENVIEARAELARRGLFVEPTCATVAAALPRLAPRIGAQERVVVALTGHGLKRPPDVY